MVVTRQIVVPAKVSPVESSEESARSHRRIPGKDEFLLQFIGLSTKRRVFRVCKFSKWTVQSISWPTRLNTYCQRMKFLERPISENVTRNITRNDQSSIFRRNRKNINSSVGLRYRDRIKWVLDLVLKMNTLYLRWQILILRMCLKFFIIIVRVM